MPGPTELKPAGETFATAKNAYTALLRADAEAKEMRTQAVELVTATEANAAKVDSERARELAEEAKLKLAELDAMIRDVELDRLTTLMRTVNSIGSTIPRLRATRAKVTLVDPADFDLRFERLVMRYKNVYRAIFPVGEGGLLIVPDPGAMSDANWEQIRTHVEGPIYLWDIAECAEKWPVAGIPACVGPDYLEALSMVNQVMEMWQTEIDLWEEFPMLAFYDYVLDGAVKKVAEAVVVIEQIFEDIRRIANSTAEIVKRMTGAAADVAEGLAKTPGWLLLAAGAAGIYLITRRNKG